MTELRTIAARVEYRGWRPVSAEVQEDRACLLFDRNRSRFWRWDDVDDTGGLWRRVATLHLKADDPQAIHDFTREWGPILRRWEKEPVLADSNPAFVPDASVKELKKCL